ncbi:MAG: putative Rossmann fold flavoprotein [Oleiphilaceae bacterium]|jgi:predicted Rossmann fold flavoprotein
MSSAKITHYDAIIIGGGASGLMCAQVAGHRGLKVLVLDSSNKVGKKILMSGGGRCNFTNYFIEPSCFLSKNSHFCKSALSRYTQWDFISLVQKHGIPYHERKHGELFCNDSAKDILKMLLDECADARVEIKTKCTVEQIEPLTEEGKAPYLLKTNLGAFSSNSLVIASGGLSIPTLGSSGFGYDVAEQFKLPLLPRTAGLVPFIFTDQIKAMTESLSGLALDVTMSVNNISFRENMLFTHRGISGPTALQISNYWKQGDSIYINLLPDDNAEDHLLSLKHSHPKSLLRNALLDKFSKSLCLELQKLWWSSEYEKPLADFSDMRLREIAEKLSKWILKPAGTEGYRTAEVTLGGVDTNCISSKTMECKIQTGLYFIGEALDVTGWLGGFNFQWAWASGVACGESL